MANETKAPRIMESLQIRRLSIIQLALDTYVDFDLIVTYCSDRRGAPSVECENKSYESNWYG